MGAMRALEWCVGYPNRVERAVVLAVSAAASAEQIALCSLQVRAIKSDPAYANGDYYFTGRSPTVGLSIARGLGQVSYRTEHEFAVRFDREAQGHELPLRGGRYAIQSYLEYQGDKLTRRFDPNTYVALSEAMNHHDVGRGRGGVGEALASDAQRSRWPASPVTGSIRSRSNSRSRRCSRGPIGPRHRVGVRTRRLPSRDRGRGRGRRAGVAFVNF